MNAVGVLGSRGRLVARKIPAPGPGLLWKLKNLRHVLPGWAKHKLAGALNMNHMYGTLSAVLFRKDGTVVNYGLISTRVITTEFSAFVVDQLQTESSVFGDFKYHDCGTGTGAEAVGDTGLGTQSTEIASGNSNAGADTRTPGTQAEASSTAYKSVGTITFEGAGGQITEHGLFNTDRGGSDTLMDRSKFDVITVASGDSIEFTYTLTVTAGG